MLSLQRMKVHCQRTGVKSTGVIWALLKLGQLLRLSSSLGRLEVCRGEFAEHRLVDDNCTHTVQPYAHNKTITLILEAAILQVWDLSGIAQSYAGCSPGSCRLVNDNNFVHIEDGCRAGNLPSHGSCQLIRLDVVYGR